MVGKTIPVTAVSHTVVARLDALIAQVRANVSETASRAINCSTVCRLAIEDALDRYEHEPNLLAERLGFSIAPLNAASVKTLGAAERGGRDAEA